MPHSEKLLQRETLGKNRVFTHERWHVQLENGRTAEREIIRHPGGVGIVAVDENGRLLMVRQYRSGMGCEALEIPAGKRDPGETPEQCGRRELEEVREALHARGLDRLTLFAKVEDRLGWEALPRGMDACDVVTVARGDLGSNLGLLRLPGAQKDMAARCRRAGKPFLVVTQQQHTMTEHPAPTRSEVLDVYNAVLDGASDLMLTSDTARVRSPQEHIRLQLDIARQAEEDQK